MWTFGPRRRLRSWLLRLDLWPWLLLLLRLSLRLRFGLAKLWTLRLLRFRLALRKRLPRRIRLTHLLRRLLNWTNRLLGIRVHHRTANLVGGGDIVRRCCRRGPGKTGLLSVL